MAAPKRYDMDFKKRAVRLAKEIGGKKAAKELNVSPDTLYGWMRKERNGSIDLGPGTRTPENALGLAEEVQQLRAENKRLGREIKRLKEENEFLEEASAFFAASRQKSKRANE